jgi:beta-N-acetylhexosaminidase
MKDARRLTLEEKVGQLFFLGFQGPAPDNETREIHQMIRPGGFLVAQRNIENFDQIYSLTASLREMSAIPALVAIEQEGGRVDRLKQVFAPLPSAAAAAAGGTAHVRVAARIIASELEATGFNVNLAPVVDVAQTNTISPDRMFSGNAAEVARLAGAFVDELAKKDIIACAKHFPGLGGATADAHFVLPRIDRSRRQLLQEDVLPFANLLEKVPMVMVSHAYYPAFGDDRQTPASLSSRIVEGFLRKKLGFRGLITTDDLTMGAISSVGLTPEVFLNAFEAGNDMLLFSQTTPLVEQAFGNLVRAVRASGALRKRLDESVERVIILKSRVPLTPLRYRSNLKSRLIRQIEKLRAAASRAAVSTPV